MTLPPNAVMDDQDEPVNETPCQILIYEEKAAGDFAHSFQAELEDLTEDLDLVKAEYIVSTIPQRPGNIILQILIHYPEPVRHGTIKYALGTLYDTPEMLPIYKEYVKSGEKFILAGAKVVRRQWPGQPKD